jgi:hypothetical protein
LVFFFTIDNSLSLRTTTTQFGYILTIERLFKSCKGKGKGKVHPKTGHEGPEGIEAVAYPGILFEGGGVQQIQLRTKNSENGDLGAVAP